MELSQHRVENTAMRHGGRVLAASGLDRADRRDFRGLRARGKLEKNRSRSEHKSQSYYELALASHRHELRSAIVKHSTRGYSRLQMTLLMPVARCIYFTARVHSRRAITYTFCAGHAAQEK